MSATLQTNERVSQPFLPQRRWLPWCFGATIFLSASLLFLVQPLMGKAILPWFGGATSVWTTAMLFFQVVLLAGYAYTWFVTRVLTPLWQSRTHIALLIACGLFFPLLPGDSQKPTPEGEPSLTLLLLLASSVGAPFFALSTTGPLLQAWHARTLAGATYRLYALSNAGSLLALGAYPLVVEPWLEISDQAWLWTAAWLLFACFCAVCAWHARAATTASTQSAAITKDAPIVGRALAWLGLAALASWMLLAATNHLCQDMAATPLLWILPLAVYLVSLIVCFDRPHWYRRQWFAPLAAASLVASSLLTALNIKAFLPVLLTDLAALFSVCMLAHGELVERRPDVRQLPLYYLIIAAGGAVGGLTVAVAAPMLFARYYEWNLALLAGYLLASGCWLAIPIPKRHSRKAKPQAARAWPATLVRRPAAFVFSMVGLAVVASVQANLFDRQAKYDIAVVRNFYGVVRIDEFAVDDPYHGFAMIHGSVTHGLQFTSPELRRVPTTYYHSQSGIGRLFQHLGASRPRRIGVVGLGVGTLAAYGQPGDYFRFYEINPEVVRLARRYFTYLDETSAEVEIVIGDGRLALEREGNQAFDLLVVDAFSGDAVPTHLLTREALALYRRHLQPDGVLALHVSNQSLDLAPVAAALAADARLHAVLALSQSDRSVAAHAAEWVFICSQPEALQGLGVPLATPKMPVWTDRYSNLLQVLRM